MVKGRETKRFESLGDETILDRSAGLVWSKDAGLFDFPMTWEEALAAVKDLNRQRWAGHATWRLPNRRELFSLIAHDCIDPALPLGHPFQNVFPGYYWTSTTCARLPAQAWYIHLGGARVQRGMKTGSYLAWPVRGHETATARPARTGTTTCWDEAGEPVPCHGSGQDGEFCFGAPWPEPRFSTGREVVVDRLTGLMWPRSLDTALGAVTWQEALEAVTALNTRAAFGYSDWRLPGIRELESLVDLGRHRPALPGNHPFVNVREYYWAADTSVYEKSYAWVLYLADGAAGVGFKAYADFFACPVRTAQKSIYMPGNEAGAGSCERLSPSN